MARMPHNLRTLKHLFEQNRDDFRKLISRRTPRAEWLEARQRFCRRRRKALTLVEELSLRTRRVHADGQADARNVAADGLSSASGSSCCVTQSAREG